jgi:hypothetical protein
MAEEMWTYAMEKMSYPDVQEILKTTDVVLIPIGSQEKHGPHIPLATDSIATIETTLRAAKKAKVPYTPMIPVGYSPHHMGTVNNGIGSLTFTGEMVYDPHRAKDSSDQRPFRRKDCLAFRGNGDCPVYGAR